VGTGLIFHDGDMRMRDSGIDPDEVRKMNRKLALLIEAISMCHESNVEGTCGPKCMACRVEEALQSIEVAERLADG